MSTACVTTDFISSEVSSRRLASLNGAAEQWTQLHWQRIVMARLAVAGQHVPGPGRHDVALDRMEPRARRLRRVVQVVHQRAVLARDHFHPVDRVYDPLHLVLEETRRVATCRTFTLILSSTIVNSRAQIVENRHRAAPLYALMRPWSRSFHSCPLRRRTWPSGPLPRLSMASRPSVPVTGGAGPGFDCLDERLELLVERLVVVELEFLDVEKLRKRQPREVRQARLARFDGFRDVER